jgi:hypothetical protein
VKYQTGNVEIGEVRVQCDLCVCLFVVVVFFLPEIMWLATIFFSKQP